MKAVTAIIPGKIMLAGEYAVLAGGRSLAATVDRTLSVSLELRPEQTDSRISSCLWPQPRMLSRAGDRPGARTEPLLNAVDYALRRWQLPALEVRVHSNLDITFGIGSSSALRLGVLLGAAHLAQQGQKQGPKAADGLWAVAREALALQREAQNSASGYDIATQALGGLVLMQPAADWPGTVSQLPEEQLHRLSRIVHPYVGGKGAPTGQVSGSTLTWLKQQSLTDELMLRSEELVSCFLEALSRDPNTASSSQAMSQLYQATARHRRLFCQSPYYPKAPFERLQQIPGLDQTWSFKTTGAGGEDAVLLIGTPESNQDLQMAQAALTEQGWCQLDSRFAQCRPEIRERHSL